MTKRVLLLCFLLTTPATAVANRQGGPPATPVRVEPVRTESLVERRTVSGEVRATRRATIAAEEPGRVVEFLVREGDAVRAGNPLARLDGTRLELELARLDAEKALARATLEERAADEERARRDLAILEDLATRGVGNPKELADARTAVAVATARHAAARADLDVLQARRALLERRIADLTPTAPFDGVVVSRETEVGEWVPAGGAICRLVSSGPAEVRLDVPQAWWAALEEGGDALAVRLDSGGPQIEVSDWRKVPEIDPRARTFRVIGTLPPASTLVPGASVTAEVPTGREAEFLTVSPDALLLADTGPYLFLAVPLPEGAGHQAQLAPVRVLFRALGRVAVSSPQLRPGALAVVEGNERLFPGAPLLPQGVQHGGERR